MAVDNDKTNPQHYKSHPSGVEAIEITQHMSFNLGNAFKYVFRAAHKGDRLNDLRKALWYIDRELDIVHRSDHWRKMGHVAEPVGTEGALWQLYCAGVCSTAHLMRARRFISSQVDSLLEAKTGRERVMDRAVELAKEIAELGLERRLNQPPAEMDEESKGDVNG